MVDGSIVLHLGCILWKVLCTVNLRAAVLDEGHVGLSSPLLGQPVLEADGDLDGLLGWSLFVLAIFLLLFLNWWLLLLWCSLQHSWILAREFYMVLHIIRIMNPEPYE